MAIMNINFTSRCLAAKTNLWVAYPTPTLNEMIRHKDKYDPEKSWPVVYMLHGAGGDGFEWIQRADVERLCCQYGFIAVMPDAQLSFYNDTPYGAKYYSYISQELPAMIESTFRASGKAEDRYIMGYSMGGFGAIKIGLMNPERYNRIASLSGCMDIAGFINAFENDSIFTIHTSLPDWPSIEGGDNDMMALLDRAAERKACGKRVPPMYHTIGRQDFIYSFSQEWRKKAQSLGLDFTYTEGDGMHDFSYWNERIASEVMPFFFGK